MKKNPVSNPNNATLKSSLAAILTVSFNVSIATADTNLFTLDPATPGDITDIIAQTGGGDYINSSAAAASIDTTDPADGVGDEIQVAHSLNVGATLSNNTDLITHWAIGSGTTPTDFFASVDTANGGTGIWQVTWTANVSSGSTATDRMNIYIDDTNFPGGQESYALGIQTSPNAVAAASQGVKLVLAGGGKSIVKDAFGNNLNGIFSTTYRLAINEVLDEYALFIDDNNDGSFDFFSKGFTNFGGDVSRSIFISLTDRQAQRDGINLTGSLAAMSIDMLDEFPATEAVPTWSGNIDDLWDTTTLNWTNDGSNTTYADGLATVFPDLPLNAVDDGSGTFVATIDVTQDVAPSSITVDATDGYIFTSTNSFGITGAPPLTKRNSGDLRIENSNDLGDILVEGGTLTITDSNNLGLDANINYGAISDLFFDNANALDWSTLTKGSNFSRFVRIVPLNEPVTLSGTLANTDATARVEDGRTLILAKEDIDLSIPEDPISFPVNALGRNFALGVDSEALIVEVGGTTQLAGAGGDQIGDASSITVDGTLDMNSRSETISRMSGSGTITSTTSDTLWLLDVASVTTVDGVVGGTITFSGTMELNIDDADPNALFIDGFQATGDVDLTAASFQFDQGIIPTQAEYIIGIANSITGYVPNTGTDIPAGYNVFVKDGNKLVLSTDAPPVEAEALMAAITVNSAADSATITFNSTPGETFDLFRSTDLEAGFGATPLQADIAADGVGSETSFMDSNLPGGKAFYQVIRK